VIPEFGRFGGTLSYFTKLVRLHRRRGLDTAVLIPPSQAFPDIVDLCERGGVRVLIGPERPNFFRRLYVSAAFDLYFCWRALRAFQPDLVVVSTGGFNEMLGALLLPRPVAITMHTYPPPQVHSWKRIGVRFFIRLACTSSRKRFVTVSEFAARSVHRFLGVPQRSLDVIYNSARAVEPASCPRGCTVLTVGHTIDYKNPMVWLEVARDVIRRMPEARFVWLGEGPCLEPMRAAVREWGLQAQISLPGFRDDVDAYYARAAVYFQPSRTESHGIAVVEAMAHGLPCVTSDVGGLPESVVHDETGYICPVEDVEGFSSRILSLLNDADLGQRMGEQGRSRVAERFTEEVWERKVLRLYAGLLSAGSGIGTGVEFTHSN
jgi:glycosyltransferase involved in cell wall biosynthesis